MQTPSEHILPSSKNYYMVMGISPSASAQEISRAFKKLALKWHPDRHGQFRKSFAHRKFVDLLEAYEVLGNPARRIRYDAYREYRESTPCRSSGGNGSVSGRQPSQRPPHIDVIIGASKKFEKDLQQWCQKANTRARRLARKSYLQFVISVDIFTKLVIQGIYSTLDIIAGKAQTRKEITACLKKIEQIPDDAGAHFRVGFLFHQNGNYDDAADFYLQSLRCRPNNADVLCNLGRLREAQGLHSRAVRCYQRAVELDPNLHVVYACLGILYLKKDQYAEAKACLDFLVNIGRLDLAAQIERAYLSKRS